MIDLPWCMDLSTPNREAHKSYWYMAGQVICMILKGKKDSRVQNFVFQSYNMMHRDPFDVEHHFFYSSVSDV